MKIKFFLQKLTIVYFVLYTIPFPFNYLPFKIGDYFSEIVMSIWGQLVPFVARELLKYDGSVVYRDNGSGDSVFFYFLIPTIMLVALATTIIWISIIDKRLELKSSIKNHFNVYLRYYMAFTMFIYGFSKVFYLQFNQLTLFQLTQSFGDSSPMGLLWKFMGYSEIFSILTGITEVFAGLLLLFRKTKVIGALICFVIMVQVFMMNISFDVPVKIYSFHLIIISLLIFLPEYKRLFNLINNYEDKNPLIFNKSFKIFNETSLRYGIKYFMILMVLSVIITENFSRQKKYGKRAATNELYGIYDVNLFIVENDTIPPSRLNFDRWDRLIIDKNVALVEKMNREKIHLQMEIDSVNSTVHFQSYMDKDDISELKFKIEGNYLILDGKIRDSNVLTKMIRKERADFFLEKRGFHWINEYPMNR
ncbi:hypothetical protein [Maribacter sp. 1_MG-2023]|uniref:hypothetical protein n=1 Tax=Maribacter sp. 1_MG-2023 TaxID=3062677 RepID=UPI0026E3963A|nr:hypothetical protein [Maribacter sp. 1_MG-2023]MDO6473069.1 hypothetical protein [Maribacter sp. 1_MG-2023]